jgi:hypothetical protein
MSDQVSSNSTEEFSFIGASGATGTRTRTRCQTRSRFAGVSDGLCIAWARWAAVRAKARKNADQMPEVLSASGYFPDPLRPESHIGDPQFIPGWVAINCGIAYLVT